MEKLDYPMGNKKAEEKSPRDERDLMKSERNALLGKLIKERVVEKNDGAFLNAEERKDLPEMTKKVEAAAEIYENLAITLAPRKEVDDLVISFLKDNFDQIQEEVSRRIKEDFSGGQYDPRDDEAFYRRGKDLLVAAKKLVKYYEQQTGKKISIDEKAVLASLSQSFYEEVLYPEDGLKERADKNFKRFSGLERKERTLGKE